MEGKENSTNLWAEIEVQDVLGQTLKCSLPFILPKGKYNHPNLGKLKTEESEWLKSWLVKSGLVSNGLSLDKLIEYSNDMATCSAYFVPDLPLGSEQYKTYVLFCGLGFLLDDVIEGRHFFGKINNGDSPLPIGDIVRGKYKTMDELPTTLPAVVPMLKGYFLACEFGKKANPEWVKESVHEAFANSFDDTLAGMAYLQFEDTYPRSSISRINQSLFKYYRRYDGGIEACVHLACMMCNVVPTEVVKKDLLYRRLVEHVCRIVTHTNDIVGIRRDVQDGIIGYNLIVHKTRYMPLQEAFAEVYEIVRGDIAEFLLIRQRILHLYGEDEQWIKILRICAQLVDGHLFWCANVRRYGKTKITIVEQQGNPGSEEFQKQEPYLQRADLITKEFNATDFILE